MPDWAEDDPRTYWDAADLHERANGRIFVSADFALSRELSVEDQIDLARAFAHELTDEERLPYTLAIHANDRTFRQLLNDERAWLAQARHLISQVESFRHDEINRFWPAVWKRWAMVVVLVLATGLATGAGYIWAARPYEAELASLRAGVELGDTIARRVLEMTPAERKQFDTLMKWNQAPNR